MKYSACLFSTSGGVISSVTELCCHDKEGGRNESTRFTDGSGAVSPQCRGLRTNLRTVRQGQSSASAAGCYERLVRAIGGDRPLCRSLSFWAGMSAIGGKADIDTTLPNVRF